MDAPTRPTADPLVGRLLDGRYRLEETVARGGMATVYTATDTRLDRVVAVKVMHRALADDPEFVAALERALESLATGGVRAAIDASLLEEETVPA